MTKGIEMNAWKALILHGMHDDGYCFELNYTWIVLHMCIVLEKGGMRTNQIECELPWIVHVWHHISM